MSGEDILQVLAVYQQRLAEFKREMEALGIKVQVSASLGKWTSTVEAAGEEEPKIIERFTIDGEDLRRRLMKEESNENAIVKIEGHGYLGDFSRKYTITPEEEERSIKLIMRDFIGYVIRGRRARYKKVLAVLVQLQKIEEKEGIKVYKDPVLERCDQR